MTTPNPAELIKTGANAALEEALNANPALADGKNEQGIPYLLFAAYYRNQVAVDLIKKHKPSLDLFEASAIGDLTSTEQLAREDSVNSFSTDGFTPLGYACYFGHYEVAKFLIGAGANVNLPSSNAFKVAPLHSACAISHVELVKLLLANGADVNARQNSGFTPLHSAAHNGNADLAQLLMFHGADANARTDAGQTPLQMAEEKSHNSVAQLIRKMGGK